MYNFLKHSTSYKIIKILGNLYWITIFLGLLGQPLLSWLNSFGEGFGTIIVLIIESILAVIALIGFYLIIFVVVPISYIVIICLLSRDIKRFQDYTYASDKNDEFSKKSLLFAAWNILGFIGGGILSISFVYMLVTGKL